MNCILLLFLTLSTCHVSYGGEKDKDALKQITVDEFQEFQNQQGVQVIYFFKTPKKDQDVESLGE